MNDVAHAEADAAIEAMEKELYRLYDKATRDMLKKQEAFMAEYKREQPKMKKKLDEGEIDEGQYLDWVRTQAITERWYDEMLTTLALDAVNTDKRAMQIINGYTPGIYANNFNWGTYQIESGTGMYTMFSLVDEDTVQRLLRDNPDLLPFADLNDAKDLAWNRQKFNSAITQGIIQGESIDNMAKRLGSVLGMDYNNAVRAARTATTSAENGGRIDSYRRAEEMGIVLKKEWLATLDGRTRHSHRELDGVSIPIDQAFENDCMYPGDPGAPAREVMNCRCTLIADIDGVDNKSKVERYSKLKGVSYDQWKSMMAKPTAKKKAKKEPEKEEPPARDMHHYTMSELKDITHAELVGMAWKIFIRINMEAGLTRDEAEHRFWLLIGNQSDSYLRRYINTHQ